MTAKKTVRFPTHLEVDRRGLAKILEKRGKAFALFELIQNAWDTDATTVAIDLSRPKNGWSYLSVTDNDPKGFHDLSHAYTLFAESIKKGDPSKRGRFNLGEKLVLALCKWAEVRSTSGTVRFHEDGTREHMPAATDYGSVFEAEIRMTKAEYDDVCKRIWTLIAPLNCATIFNGQVLTRWQPLASFRCTLPTVMSDEEGNLKRTNRKTIVRIFEPSDGQKPMIYELGIPVVRHDGRFHIDVHQKVPVNLDRDNVPPSYLLKLQAQCFNVTHHLLSPDDSRETWVNDAIGHNDVEDQAVRFALKKRFGEKCFIWDPTDLEANNRLTAEGYTAIAGGTFGKDAWRKIRETGVVKRAGEISPTPHAEDGAKTVPESSWTPGMHQVRALCHRLAEKLLGCEIDVQIVYGRGFQACFGTNGRRPQITFFFEVLGRRWFDEWHRELDRTLDLVYHEFAHFYSGNHLSEEYYHALSSLAARGTILALREPEVFRKDR